MLGLLREAFMHEPEDFPCGSVAITPSGRRVIIKKHLTGASKFDPFTRIVCRYEDGGPKDLVTLQPHQLRAAPAAKPDPEKSRGQTAFDFGQMCGA
jgi:hypothetical protein